MNKYDARKAALSDTKACAICSKPTVTVLYNEAMQDWIYTCDIHLQDNPQFVKPIYPPEYQITLQELQDLKVQIDSASKMASPSWNNWVSKIYKKKQKQDEKDEEPNLEAEKSSLATLKQEYATTLDKISNIRSRNKKYQLSDTMFESRVQNQKKLQLVKQRRQKEEQAYTNTDPNELLAKYSFPEVPKDIK